MGTDMDGKYLKVFVDWLERYQRLSDAEFGRLMRAAIAYKATGEQIPLSGREELLIDGIKLDIDRDQAKYETEGERRSNAGRIAANARWNNAKNANDANRINRNAKDAIHAQDKEEDKDKEKDVDVQRPRNAWASDGEMESLAADLDAVLDAAAAIGIPQTPRDIDRSNALTAEYSAEWVREALRRAGEAPATARCWRYVEGILKGWRQKGGIDSPTRAQEPEKPSGRFWRDDE